MADWTTEEIAARITEAARTLKRLPEQRVQGYFSTWPRIRPEFSDLVGREPEPARMPPPSAAAITRMEEVLEVWMPMLAAQEAGTAEGRTGKDVEVSKLLWARAEGTPWKAICWRFGISRATAHRRWEYGLSLLAWRLGGRSAAKLTRQKLVERVRQAERTRGVDPTTQRGRSA